MNNVKRLIGNTRSVMFAADVADRKALRDVVGAIGDVPRIDSYKVGCVLGLQDLKEATAVIWDETPPSTPVVYDHQKAGNDIPEMGAQYARVLKSCGVSAAILFPFTGPATQTEWTKACRGEGLEVIIGGMMTHQQFLASEGGYIADNAPERIYRLACEQGVQHFVVPGNKKSWVEKIRGWLDSQWGDGNYVLYAPGFITQGGDISECGAVAGNEWHAIVGSGIYKQPTREAQRATAIAVTKQITAVPA